MLFFHFSDWKLANAADTLFNALRDLAHTIITWSVSSQLEQDHAWQVLKGVAYSVELIFSYIVNLVKPRTRLANPDTI